MRVGTGVEVAEGTNVGVADGFRVGVKLGSLVAVDVGSSVFVADGRIRVAATVGDRVDVGVDVADGVAVKSGGTG